MLRFNYNYFTITFEGGLKRMREKQSFIICVNDEQTARQRAMEWYAKKQNLTIESVMPYPKGGYTVSISFDSDRKISM